MLTGGEPMLRPDVIRSAVSDIRAQTDAPVYLYTAMTHGLDDILPIIDGLTLTIHEEEAGDVPCSNAWKVKSNMHWIKDCPLPDGEVLMRY